MALRTKPLPSVRGLVIVPEYGRSVLASTPTSDLIVISGTVEVPEVGVRLCKIDDTGAVTRLDAPDTGRDLLPSRCTSVAISRDGSMIAAADGPSGDVRLFQLPSLSFRHNLTRPASTTRALAFSSDSSVIAVGGDDTCLRLIRVEEPVTGAQEVRVHAFIKALQFDPRGEFLLATQQDGSVSILSVGGPDAPPVAVITRLEGFKLPLTSGGDSYHDAEFPCSWHPTGDVVAIATDAGATVLARGSWSVVYKLRCPGALGSGGNGYSGTCGLAWSPNGRYLAAMDGRRLLTVWDCCVGAVDPLTDAPLIRDDTGACDAATALYGYAVRVVVDGGAALDNAQLALEAPFVTPGNGDARPTGLAWSSSGEHIFYVDVDGHLGVSRVSSLSRDAPTGKGTAVEALTQPLAWPIMAPPPKPKASRAAASDRTKYMDGEAAESEGEGAAPGTGGADDAAAAAPRPKSTVTPASDPGDADISISATKRQFGFVDAEEEDEDGIAGLRRMDDLPGGGSGMGISEAALRDAMDAGHIVTPDQLQRSIVTAGKFIQDVFGLVPAQAAFTPGETPFRRIIRSHQSQRRYITWNAIGAIISRREPLSFAVSIDFTDSSRHRSMNLNDVHGYTTGALAHGGVVLASPYRPPREVGDKGTASIITFKPLGATLDGSDWRWELPVVDATAVASSFSLRRGGVDPDRAVKKNVKTATAADAVDDDDDDDAAGIVDDDDDEHAFERDEAMELDTSAAAESVQCIAVGDGWVAAATDAQFVRFFRFAGVQDAVIALRGAPVCIAGAGALCAVVYHTSIPTAFTQHMTLDLYVNKCSVDGATSGEDGARLRRIASVGLPLRPHTTLTWLAFADNGAPVIQDSLGMLYALQAGMDWTWTPICDTGAAARARSSSSADSAAALWPIAVMRVPAAVSQPDVPEPLVGKRDAPVLTLAAVPVKKGTRRFPHVSAVRPVPLYIPLHMPLLPGPEEAMDEALLRHELSYRSSVWAHSMGLSPHTLSAQTLAAAVEAAGAASRGEYGVDAVSKLASLRAESASGTRGDAATIDKAILRGIHSACKAGDDARAAALATRLHLDKSLEVAVRVVGSSGRTTTAERLTQFMHLRAAEASAEDPVNTAATAELLARAQALASATVEGRGPAAAGSFGLAGARTSGARPASSARKGGLADIPVVTSSSSGGLAALKAKMHSSVDTVMVEEEGGAGDDPAAPAHGGSSGVNPFGKRAATMDVAALVAEAANGASPPRKRARDGDLASLLMASPAGERGGALLNRQSSVVAEARSGAAAGGRR